MRTRTHFICIGMHFDYVCHLAITNIMEAAFGRLHKGGRAAFGGPPPFCGLLYFLFFLGSTFKNSFENDVKRQKVGFGVSISLLGYVKSTLNVRQMYVKSKHCAPDLRF